MTRPAPIIAGTLAVLLLLFGAYMGGRYALVGRPASVRFKAYPGVTVHIPPEDNLIGLWVPEATSAREPFYFHGDSISIDLVERWGWQPDEIYRLKTKRIGEDLYALYPNKTWYRVASCRNGRFVVLGDGWIKPRLEKPPRQIVWEYERVAAKDAPNELRPLLKPRPVYHYSGDFRPTPTPITEKDQRRLQLLYKRGASAVE